MGGKKICLTVDEESYKAFSELAKKEGFSGVPALVRHLAVSTMADTFSADRKKILIRLNNYSEIESYVAGKKLGSIESLATFAMEQYMTKNPLSDAQKAKLVKLVD